MKASTGNPSLLAELQRDFERIDKDVTLATLARNTVEVQEYEAEAVVNHCLYFLRHASELWQKWPVDLQNKLQLLVLPGGVGYEVLEGQANPDLSLVYAAFENSAMMAAPRCGVTNSTIRAMIEWYKVLKSFPMPVHA